jgi:hypothetical protein
MGFPLPSVKTKVFAKGNAVQGTSMGFVILNPFLAAMNDVNCVYYSETAAVYAGTSPSETAGTVGVGESVSNARYASADISTSGIQYRVVSAGLRVKYRGTELNRGGRFIAYEHPSHGTTVGMTNGDQLAMPGVTSVGVEGGDAWVSVVMSGVKQPEELNYRTVTSSANGTRPFLSITWDGGANPTFSVEWEAYVNLEYIGTAIVGLTPSHHDPVGASVAANAVNTAQISSMHSSHPDFGKSVLDSVEKYGKAALSTAVSAGSSFVKDHGMDILKTGGSMLWKALPALLV